MTAVLTAAALGALLLWVLFVAKSPDGTRPYTGAITRLRTPDHHSGTPPRRKE